MKVLPISVAAWVSLPLGLLLFQVGPVMAQTDVPRTPNQPQGESPIPPESKSAELSVQNSGKGEIQELAVETGTLELVREGEGVSVIVSGTYKRKDWSLLVRSRPVNIREGKFRAKVPIRSRDTFLTVRAVGPGGDIEQIIYKIFVKEAPPPIPPSHLDILVSLGGTSVKYTQTGFPSLNQNGVTGKLAARYHFRESPWDIGGSIFGTLLPFGSKLAGVSARFLGINARGGYTLPKIQERWRISLLGGLYYSTMMVSGSDLGYSNYVGLQFFPAIAYRVSERSEVSTYFKYAPILDGFKFKPSDREIALGVALNIKREVSGMWQLAFDYGDLKTSTPIGVASVKTLSLALGYGF